MQFTNNLGVTKVNFKIILPVATLLTLSIVPSSAQPGTGTGSYNTVPVVVPPLGGGPSPTNGPGSNSGSTYSNGSGYNSGNRAFNRQTAPGVMANPAYTQQGQPSQGQDPYQSGMDARSAERERVIENMRQHGYSEDRIRAMYPYMGRQEDPAGTKYKNVGGLRMRDDGVTPQQALRNITTNGVMNTPITTDPNAYAQGTYGWYHNHGGRKNFDQWLHGER